MGRLKAKAGFSIKFISQQYATLAVIMYFTFIGVINAGTSTLSGYVRDGATLQPVPNIEVSIIIDNSSGYIMTSATTTSEGKFSIVYDNIYAETNNRNNTIEAEVTSISSRPFFTIQNTNEQEAKIIIYDITGREVKKINAPLLQGINNIQWDARNDNGVTVSNGVYITRIQVGKKCFDKKFVMLKGLAEGLPLNTITTEYLSNKPRTKTNESTRFVLTIENDRYNWTRDEFICDCDTTVTVFPLPNKPIQNPFVINHQKIEKFSQYASYYILEKNKPLLPIQVNINELPVSYIGAVSQAMNNIDSLTETNFTAPGTPNDTTSSIKFIIVNDDTTQPILNKNIYSRWTESNTTGQPTKGEIFINGSHNLTANEITAYSKKALLQLILNTTNYSYNKNHCLFPKGLQLLNIDEIELLKFYYNYRVSTEYFDIPSIQTDSINVFGKIDIPDTATGRLKIVNNAIVHLDELTDTTDMTGEYIFPSVPKGLHNIIIDSVKVGGVVEFHQYEEEGTSMPNDITEEKVMFPKIVKTIQDGRRTHLDQFKENIRITSTTENTEFYKPEYGDKGIQILLDTTNCPNEWRNDYILGTNKWIESETGLFETVQQTLPTRTKNTIHYEHNGGQHVQNYLAIIEAKTAAIINKTPYVFNAYLNIEQLGQFNPEIRQKVITHLLYRIQYGEGTGAQNVVNNPISIGYSIVQTSIDLWKITNDDKIQSRIIKNIPRIRINNYKN
ncbi:MAG: FlgD immunoglobulin-like domain containing protein [bacterium]